MSRRSLDEMDEDDYDQDLDDRDDTDPTAWGFGQDEEDIEDEWGAAINSNSESGSEYFGSDDDNRLRRGGGGPQLGEAGPSRPRGAPDPEDDEGADMGMDDLESGQFGRLVKSIRSGTNLSGSAVLTENWDQSIEEADAEAEFAAGPAAGAGRRNKRRGTGTTGRRREPELDPAIQQLLGQGNMYYVSEDYVKAIETYQEVITLEPAVHVAWTTLSTCHAELGNEEKALQCEMMAAHLRPSNEVWKDLGSKSRAKGAMEQAIYCYKKAIACNHDDIDAIWDHAYLLRETGQHAKAIDGFQTILRQNPNDLAIILEMSNSFVEARLLPLGERLILNALHKQQRDFPDPTEPDAVPPETVLFPISLLVVLFDILIATEQWGKAIMECKKAVRWLGGRLKETRWEKVGDDREFDLEGVKRRTGMGPGEEGREAEGYVLDINLRHRLGLARLNLGDVDEARMHFDIIKSLDPVVYQVLWGEIADAYLAKSMFDDALEYYEPLSEITSLPKHVEGRGDCLRANQDYEGAKESYLFVIASFENKNDPASLKVRMKTAYVFEQLGQRQEALDLVNGVLAIRRTLPVSRGRKRKADHTLKVDATGSILNRGPRAAGSEKQIRLNRDQIEDLNIQRVEQGFARLAALDAVMDGEGGVDAWDEDGATAIDWMGVAGPLIEQFRETRLLFPQDRNKKFTGLTSNRGKHKAASKAQKEEERQAELEAEAEEQAEAEAEGFSERLQRDIEGDAVAVEDTKPESTTLRGVAIQRWFDVAIKYCCLLAKYEDPEHAYEIADHLLYANVFRQPERQQALRLTGLACLMVINDTRRIGALGRQIFHIKQFSNLALHVLVSSLGSGLQAAEALVNVNLQKALSRDMRIWEASALGDEDVKFHPISGRWSSRQTRAKNPGRRKSTVVFKGTGKGRKKAGTETAGKGKEKATAVLEEDEEEGDEGEEHDQEPDDEQQQQPYGSGDGRFGEVPVQPTKPSPTFAAYFGAIMCLGRSYQSGIYYLLRAYDLNPVDPLICLMLAVAYIGRAFQRQADNRNFCIVTAMAFLDKYRKLHPDGQESDEVEYNFGTMFHRMGLYYLAISHFRKVLDRAEKTKGAWKEDPKSLVRETAYNLSLIYGTCGSPHAARDLARRWLTI